MPFPRLPAGVRIAVIGLGYVGLPLAAALGQKYPTTGFDLKQQRVQELTDGHDSTGDVAPEALKAAQMLRQDGVLFDMKAAFPAARSDLRL